MNRIVRNFAPKGYHAVADKSKTGCVGCSFEGDTQCGLDRKCASSERPDKQNVIFVANVVDDAQNLIEEKMVACSNRNKGRNPTFFE